MTAPPRKTPGLAVLIGVGKPKGAMPKPPMDDDDGGMPGGDDHSQGKATPEAAGVLTGDQRCVACEYYIHPSHECQKVAGNNFGTEIVGCSKYFEPADEGPEGDESSETTTGEPGQMAPSGSPGY